MVLVEEKNVGEFAIFFDNMEILVKLHPPIYKEDVENILANMEVVVQKIKQVLEKKILPRKPDEVEVIDYIYRKVRAIEERDPTARWGFEATLYKTVDGGIKIVWRIEKPNGEVEEEEIKTKRCDPRTIDDTRELLRLNPLTTNTIDRLKQMLSRG